MYMEGNVTFSEELEAALDAFWHAAYEQGRDQRDHDDEEGTAQKAEDDLRKAIAAISASPPAVVKPLEWREQGNGWFAERYRIWEASGYFIVSGWASGTNPYENLEAAKSAAFADYSARIMSAIEPAGVTMTMQPLGEEFQSAIGDREGLYEPAGVGVETPPPSTHVEAFEPFDLSEIVAALEETYKFAATSRKSQQNINFVLEQLDAQTLYKASKRERQDVIDRMRKALEPFAEVANRFDGVPVSAILPQQCWFTPHSLREARAALKGDEQ